uniref:Protein kinase domain-containing protein n=1 Tax=Chlamydomonas euryale TaxID=1486919 RepID=A0A7R9VAN1_9CHLO|mmetsp:Transcript_28526/g.84457  ORF Transcript_28526/g.84457 Transcript_28526/m.84457 type:complete len:341 (-) Transcript_28526:196-1218(-)
MGGDGNSLQAATEPDPLAEFHGPYEKIQQLGHGSFGFVQLARRRDTGELAAIKFLQRGCISKYTEAEILNHSLLRHPHIIQFREVFLTSEHICIAMEYATGGSLFEYVQKQGRLKEAVARWFFQQLVIGTDYCHKRGVANRDIKLENTLLQVCAGLPLPLLKICDFGYSKADSMSVAKSKVGTLTYMAPEVLVNRDGKYDGKVADIWSCGVMLYVMLYGRYPFEMPPGHNQQPKVNEITAVLEKMVNMQFAMPSHVEVSAEGKDLLQRMLAPDPKQRVQLEHIMVHPWFTTNLPPEATTMNEAYMRAELPPGVETRVDVHTMRVGTGLLCAGWWCARVAS